MPTTKQSPEPKPEAAGRRAVQPAVPAAPGRDPVALPSLPAGDRPGSAAATGHASRLIDPRLAPAQRQALASQIGRLGGNRRLGRLMVSLDRTPSGETAAPAVTPFNVALYDYNLAHMFIRGEGGWPAARRAEAHERQRNAFRGWAQRWARGNHALGLDGVTPGSAFAMNERQEIIDGINNTYRAANRQNAARGIPEDQWRRIDTVAFFCHGSPDSGLVHLGVRDVRAFLRDVQNALSPNVRFLLFACSTGQGRWERGMIGSEAEVESEEIRAAEGGRGSWAARLAEALVARGVDLGQEWRGSVWGHTTSGSAVGVPNWREFRAQFERLDPVTRRRIYAIEGRSYFAYVFDATAVATSDFYLRNRYEGLSAAARRARGKEFPADAGDLRDRWMYPFYLTVARGDVASRIPDDPDGSKQRLLDAWHTYYTGHSATALSGTTGGRFIRANNFDDLPAHLPERAPA